MTCQKCQKREATVHEHDQTEDGKGWREVHLCEQCSGKTPLALLTSGGLLQALMQGGAIAEVAAGPELRCPDCGITYAEFRSRGRLGCPRDYEVFEADLLPLLARLHQGRVEHVGKVPGGGAAAPSPAERELLRLRRALEEHVRKEEYEEAARTRDLIRAAEAAVAAEAGTGPPSRPVRAPAKGRGGRSRRKAAPPPPPVPGDEDE